ncbi:MAG TPA: hypothetical protein VKE92_06705 [Anaerolineales bacterium]|nr:hypothetical protein [Anaerolineales bacterium]
MKIIGNLLGEKWHSGQEVEKMTYHWRPNMLRLKKNELAPGEVCHISLAVTPDLRNGIAIADQNFYPIGWCFTHGCHVWPIDEFIARTQMFDGQKYLQKEIKILKSRNLIGKCEWMLPNGLTPTRVNLLQAAR